MDTWQNIPGRACKTATKNATPGDAYEVLQEVRSQHGV